MGISMGKQTRGTAELNSDDGEEVETDAIQLLVISNFNGICRIVAALAANGLLSPNQLENIHDCMTAPLDDQNWRDYSFIVDTRDILETVLARAAAEARDLWTDGDAASPDRS